MKLERIEVANNGFVLETLYGDTYIAKTLLEAAEIAGEPVRAPARTEYTEGFTVGDLIAVKERMREGKKIDAIKILRNCFTPRLGLREAKDIVEVFCG